MDVRVHPTAIIDPGAHLPDDIVVGPHAVIERGVVLGRGCIVRARAFLSGPIVVGERNDFGVGCVVGERAQHLTYSDAPGTVIIGDGNVFRENVTVHRGTPLSPATRIGNDNYFMANSHVAHDAVVGNNCIFANTAAIAGHVTVGDRAFLSACSGVQQHCRVGRLVFHSASSLAITDIPPFAIHISRSTIAGVNVVGMRRAGCTTAQISAVRRAYAIMLNSGELLRNALLRIEAEVGHVDLVRELVEFIRASKRGISLKHSRRPPRSSDDVEAA